MREGGFERVGPSKFDVPSAGDVVILKPDDGPWSKFKRKYVLERGALARAFGPDKFAGKKFLVTRRYFNESHHRQYLQIKRYPHDELGTSETFDVPADFFMKDASEKSFLERQRKESSDI
jgi:hypothetical protein